jgi:hypothetical protein
MLIYLDYGRRKAFLRLYLRGLELQEVFAPNDTATFLSLMGAYDIEKRVREIGLLSGRLAIF